MPYYDPSSAPSPTYDPATEASAAKTIAGGQIPQGGVAGYSKGLKPGEIAPGIMGNWAAGPDGKPVFNDPTKAGWSNQDEDVNKGLLASYYGMLGSRTAPTATAAQLGDAATYGGATIDQTQANQARNYQMGLMGQLGEEAAGKGPSIAGAQMQAGLASSLQQQAAMAGSGGGGANPALAMRNLQYAGAQQQQQTAQAAGIARLQEQQAAQQQLAGLSGNVRGQDLGVAGQQAGMFQQAGLANMGAQNQFSMANAGFNQQTALANQQSQLGLMGMTQQGQQWALGQDVGMSEAERQARLQWEQMQQGNRQFNASLGFQKDQASTAERDKMVGAVVGGVEGGLDAYGRTKSDARAKTDIIDESSGDDSPYETPAQESAQSGKTFAQRMDSIREQEASRGIGSAGSGDSGVDWAKLGGTALAIGMMASDERGKTDVHIGASGQLLDPLTPYSYRYKDPSAPGASPGRKLGVMAQDLEKSVVGRSAVHDSPNGKMVDYSELGPPMLAAEADMHDRLSVVEQMLGIGTKQLDKQKASKATTKRGK